MAYTRDAGRGVLGRLGVRRNLVGAIINLLREEAEFVTIRGERDLSPNPDDNAFCACAEQGRAAFYCHVEQEAFSPRESGGQGHLARRADPHDPPRSLNREPVMG